MTLEWVGMIPGKRESRRFEGDYMLTQQDVVEQRVHYDAVSYGGWAIDLHPPDGVYSPDEPCVQWHSKGVYQIPYRAMYSRNVPNLFQEFEEMADPRFFNASQAVPMELKAGEFFIFNEKTLHFSEANRSQRRRRGMTIRVTIPIVRINHDVPPLHPGHAAILLRGEDYMRFNRLCEPPTTAG
jgi:hypothetical protein